MRLRLLIAVLALSAAAWADTLSLQQLVTFVRGAAKINSDQEIARYLGKVKLKERLDDRTVEELQGLGVGPKTLQALHKLSEESAGLAAATAKPVVEPPKPKPIPPPSPEVQAAILAEVRQYALNYTQQLPDFICVQVTRRKAAPAPGGKYGKYASQGGNPNWQTLDTLTLRLSYFDKQEKYKLILKNHSPSTEDYEKIGGPKEFGSFGSLMKEIFEPHSQARFDWDHWGTLRGHRVVAFSYRVAQERSQYRLVAEDIGRSVVTAYHGLVEVDPDTHVVMRITVVADNIPADFPMKQAETTLDYDYTELSGHTFLLPLKVQTLMAGGDVLNRLEEEFRLYRKYSAESELKFDTEPLAPLPEDQTRETPVPQAAPTKK
jgi:hypothetical protein